METRRIGETGHRKNSNRRKAKDNIMGMKNRASLSGESLESSGLSSGSYDPPGRGTLATDLGEDLGWEIQSKYTEAISPVIRQIILTWSSSLDDEDIRRSLLTLIPRIADTKSSTEVENKRSWMAADCLFREWLPSLLDLIPQLEELGPFLRSQPPVTSIEEAVFAGPCINGTAARVMRRGEIRHASASQTASLSGAAVLAASRADPWNQAWDIMWNASKALYTAASIVARGDRYYLLQPAIEKMQQSAIKLIERMIAAE